MISGKWREGAPIIAVILIAWLTSYSVLAEQPGLSLSSRDGTATVAWHNVYGEYDSLSVLDSQGRLVVRYPVINDQGWVLSGLADGQYALVLRSSTKTFDIGTLHISHYSLLAAIGFFAIGLLMFAYLLFTLYRSNKRFSHD